MLKLLACKSSDDNCKETGKVVNSLTGKCLLCAENCRKCEDNDINKCISCHKDNVLTTNNTCEKECLPGTFYKAEAGKCKYCMNDCLQCNNETTCNVCKSGLFLQPSKESCETFCPIKYRKNNNGVCENCSDSKCNVCDKDKNTCETCEPNFFLLNGKCLTEFTKGKCENHPRER